MSWNQATRQLIAFGLLMACVMNNAAVSAQGGTGIKDARLLTAARDIRENPGGVISPPTGSLFLWVELQVPATEKTPVQFDLSKVQAVGSQGRYSIVGISNFDVGPAVRAVLGPIAAAASGSSQILDSMSSGNDQQQLEISGSRRTFTAKTVPLVFSLVFVVPARGDTFRIEGLTTAPLQTQKLAIPK